MIIRAANIDDIPQMKTIRNAVTENVLSDPGLVTDSDYTAFIALKGKGWVCAIDNKVVGFAIVDLEGNNVWALFLHPEFEKMGIGRQLHATMLDWYFAQTKEKLWLSTAFHTRAEQFYRKAGWTEAGLHRKEIKFEMTYDHWMNLANR